VRGGWEGGRGCRGEGKRGEGIVGSSEEG